jgi:hypothetical protein
MTDEFDSLDPNVRWIVTEARRQVPADAAARRRLLDAIKAEPVPSREFGLVAWLSEPRRFSLPPFATAALAAGLVGIGVLGGLSYNRDGRPAAAQLPAVAVGQPQLPDSVAPRAIKFVLIAPQASNVSLVGDFNRWDARATPMKAADGTWTVFVPLQPGMHTYSFVVDGSHFMSDPTAPMAPDDGFGHRNSVVLVKRPAL